MKKIATWTAILALSLVMTSCSLSRGDGEVSPSAQPSAAEERNISVEVYSLSTGINVISKAIKEIKVSQQPNVDLIKHMLLANDHLFSNKIEVLDVTIQNDTAKIDFSAEMAQQPAENLVYAAELCAMTLSQSQPVTAVSLTAEGTPIPDMAYYPSRLVTKSSDLNIPVRMFTLYFPDKQATGLLAEYRLMPLEDGADYTVVSELLAGTSDFENKINIIPQGTKINSVTTDNGLCTIDFSQEFIRNHTGGSASDSLVIYSIVNALTELKSCQNVQFLVNGNKYVTFGGYGLDQPFERKEDIIVT